MAAQSTTRNNARLNHIGCEADMRTLPNMPWSMRLRMMAGCRCTVAVGIPSLSCATRAPSEMPEAATTVSASAIVSINR